MATPTMAREPLRLREGESLAGPAERLAAALNPLHIEGVAALSDRLNLDRRIGARAFNGRKVNASAYLQLCAGVGIDPHTGAAAPKSELGPVLWWFLGAAVVMRRLEDGVSQREAARAIGVVYVTVHRIEQAKPVSVKNFLNLCRYVEQRPECFTGNIDCNTQARAA